MIILHVFLKHDSDFIHLVLIFVSRNKKCFEGSTIGDGAMNSV